MASDSVIARRFGLKSRGLSAEDGDEFKGWRCDCASDCDFDGGAVGGAESELRPLQLEKNLQGFAVTPDRTEKKGQREGEEAAMGAEEAKKRWVARRRVMRDVDVGVSSELHFGLIETRLWIAPRLVDYLLMRQELSSG